MKKKKMKRSRGMTRAKFFDTLASRDAITEREMDKKDVKIVFQELEALISEELGNLGKVPIGGLGVLQLKDRAARMARNPQTGEKIHVPARKAVKFRVAANIRRQFAPRKKKGKKIKKKSKE